MNFWYPLDNAAKIFPAITTKEITSVFRISVILKNDVDIKKLRKTVYSIEPRFPYYNVKLKKGFFWYYFESADFVPFVEKDEMPPCRSFDLNGCLYRVLYIKNKLSIEFSHMLTDGSGAFEYLKTLLVSYFEFTEADTTDSFNYLKINKEPDPEEFEDAYNRYFKEDVPAFVKRPKAFHLPFPIKLVPRYDVIYALVSLNDIKVLAKEKGVNLTIYLTSVYLYVLQDIYENLGHYDKQRKYKKLSVEVPINLRNIYPSQTMRNFTLFVMPEIDLSLGHYTFDEIIKTVYHQMQLETDEKLINKILARNVGSERNILIRSVPLFLKIFLMKANYYSLGSNQFSGLISNLGRITFPHQINEHIDYMTITPCPPDKMIKIYCGVVGSNDKLSISFGNITKSKELENKFIQFLIAQNISVKLTN